MHFIDWLIVITLLIVMVATAAYIKPFGRNVSCFLAANRSAGRYLLCISDGMAGFGAITIVALWEMYYQAGFPVVWWDMLRTIIIPTILGLCGWVIYRFRQTRAFTLGEFLETRYSRRFRVFVGVLAWFSGIINFGIFPVVGARFFLYFLGIPESTFAYIVVISLLLFISVMLTVTGGQISVLVIDFIQGVFCSICFIIISIYVLSIFKWNQITEALSSVPDQMNMFHPFHISNARDFNPIFYLVIAFCTIYTYNIWQGNQGFNAAALTPHEAKMGRIWGTWRYLTQSLFILIIPICAFTFLNHPDFTNQAFQAKATIAAVGNETIKKQTMTTIAIAQILPAGIKGCLCAVVLAAFIGNHQSYLHSWGSIFIQDVVIPLRKKTLSEFEHIRLLRQSIIGIAVFVFVFSMLFRQTEYIIMFFAVTGTIFTGGAGVVVIGGLYWKRATISAAWSGMITGSCLATAGILLQQIQAFTPFRNHPLLTYIATRNGMVISFWASITACLVFIVVSLFGRASFNMDKMLHRGQYSIEQDVAYGKNRNLKFGISRDFTQLDKIIFLCTAGWITLWSLVFGSITIYNFAFDPPVTFWIDFWKLYLYVILTPGIIATVWITVGGVIDLKKMIQKLKRESVTIRKSSTVKSPS